MPCSRATLGLLLALALLWLVRAIHALAPSPLLILEPAALWRGQLWRPFTASLLVAGLLDLAMNALALAWLAAGLERHWRPREWLSHATLCAAAAGLAAAALFPRAPSIPAGPALLVFPLLVARARLGRAERIHFSTTTSAPLPAVLLLAAVLALLSALATGLPLPGLVALASAAAFAWLHLAIRWRRHAAAPARPVETVRFHRLEL